MRSASHPAAPPGSGDRRRQPGGDHGAFPAPEALRTLDLDLPGRKGEYLHAVADAALERRLDAAALRSVDSQEAIRVAREVKGLGPFAAEHVVARGANADCRPADVAEIWRPFRTWASVHLRILRERRTAEINGPARPAT